MITSLLKGILFVLLMFFYSAAVWRVVNDYFRKEFKSYIELDPDVSQDKELKTMLTHPATTPAPPDYMTTNERMSSLSGDYNGETFGQSIGPPSSERIASAEGKSEKRIDDDRGDAKTISITSSKPIEHPLSSTPTSATRTPNNNQPDATTVLIELSAPTPSSGVNNIVKPPPPIRDDRIGKQRQPDVGVIGVVDDAAHTEEANAISSGNQNEMNAQQTPSVGAGAAPTTTPKVITSSHDAEEVRTEVEFSKFTAMVETMN